MTIDIEDFLAAERARTALRPRRRPAVHVSDVKILRALATHADQHHGIPPTMKELTSLTGVASTSAIKYRLNRLIERGLCYSMDRRWAARSVTITPAGRAHLERSSRDDNA